MHKTGLGSSAALISSLVTALLVHLGVPPREQIREGGLLTSSALALAHNTAQYVHCLAQGKIGSGFDVSAAIYGSHLYTRFDPKVLEPVVSKDTVCGFPCCALCSPLISSSGQRCFAVRSPVVAEYRLEPPCYALPPPPKSADNPGRRRRW